MAITQQPAPPIHHVSARLTLPEPAFLLTQYRRTDYARKDLGCNDSAIFERGLQPCVVVNLRIKYVVNEYVNEWGKLLCVGVQCEHAQCSQQAFHNGCGQN